MKEAYFIFIGWLLGLLSMFVMKWIQAKEEERKKEIDIISDNLKFLFSTKQVYNNFRTDKLVYEKMRSEYPERAPELETKMYENFDKVLQEDFFPQLMFQSFQLKRLKDKSFWKDFEKIMSGFEELGQVIMAQEKEEIISHKNSKIMDLKKRYIEKCQIKSNI